MNNTEIGYRYQPQVNKNICSKCGEEWFMTHVCPKQELKFKDALVEAKTDLAVIHSLYNQALTDAAAILTKELIEIPRTQYQEQYNDGIQSLIDKILGLKK